MRRAFISLIAVLAALAGEPSARADATAADQAAAQVLFDQGKDAAKAGRWAEACSKFEESQRLDPRIATQFKLADCFEQIGRTASAWTNFVGVAAATKAAGQADREQVARDRAAALQPKLSRLTIQVESAARVEGLIVKRDGAAVGAAVWGVAVPIDPGKHTVVASAPGRKAWEGSVIVLANGASATLRVPDLAVDDSPPPSAASASGAAPAADGATSTGTGQRVVGIALGAVGIAGLGIGTAFGLAAKSKHDEAGSHCRTESLCDAQGIALTDDARAAGNVSTIAFIAGGAALVGGVIVFLTAPSSAAPAATGRRIEPRVGLGTIGVAGAW